MNNLVCQRGVSVGVADARGYVRRTQAWHFPPPTIYSLAAILGGHVMKRVVFTLTALAAVVTTGFSYAQDPAASEHPAYEKLKVLEGFVGEWHGKTVNEENNVTQERRATTSWSDSKGVLIVQSQVRRAAEDEDITKQKWRESERGYYIWNQAKQRIEFISVQLWWGASTSYEVRPKEDGVVDYRMISTSLDAEWKLSVVMAKDKYTIKVSNRKDAQGEPLDDFERTMERVK
jgi:hypothetical protein